MSTPPPPEPPTRRLEPTAAPPPPPVYEPGVAPVGADPNLLFVRLEDSISSLRTALMFVGILAVLAIGIAIYALTRDDTPAGTSGAVTSQQVTQLNDRVDRLSRQLQQLRADVRGTSALASRVDALARSVSTLRSQAGSGAAATDQTQAIQALNKRVDDLARQVQTLSQGQTTTP
jgi:polyhydroxyalkanoate synthesis regulator phasin